MNARRAAETPSSVGSSKKEIGLTGTGLGVVLGVGYGTEVGNAGELDEEKLQVGDGANVVGNGGGGGGGGRGPLVVVGAACCGVSVATCWVWGFGRPVLDVVGLGIPVLVGYDGGGGGVYVG